MLYFYIFTLKVLIIESISSLKVFSMYICMNRMYFELVMI